MPDPDCSYQTDRTWELQQIVLSRNGYQRGDTKKERVHSKKLELNVSHSRGHVYRNTSLKGQSPPKKARGKESSKHFGVRFRPDLHKWVAEIRVAEWKSVDKKVWLGTFDTELGAARAVDAARKLLKCKKKRPPNFPCLNLDAYAETLPSHLSLNDLGNDAMFKEVTLFVKHKVQEYAASFGPSTLSDCVSVVTSDPTTSFYSPASTATTSLNTPFSFHSQPSFVSSCEADHGDLLLYQHRHFPCQGLPAVSSSWSSSNSEEDELAWAHLNEPSCSFDTLGLFHDYADLVDDPSMVECETTTTTTMNAKSPLSWEEPILFSFDDVGDEELLRGFESRIPSDDQAYSCSEELTSMDVSYDEMPSNNCLMKPDYMSEFQRTASSTVDISIQRHPFSSTFLMSALDCLQVH